jgi:hypothetical protein
VRKRCIVLCDYSFLVANLILSLGQFSKSFVSQYSSLSLSDGANVAAIARIGGSA